MITDEAAVSLPTPGYIAGIRVSVGTPKLLGPGQLRFDLLLESESGRVLDRNTGWRVWDGSLIPPGYKGKDGYRRTWVAVDDGYRQQVFALAEDAWGGRWPEVFRRREEKEERTT